MSGILHNHILIYRQQRFEISPVERFLALGEATSRYEVDDYGFRRERSLVDGTKPTSSTRLLRFARRSGVIVGEGDTGKTWLVDALAAQDSPKLRVLACRLRDYDSDETRLRLPNVADTFWKSRPQGSVRAHLIFDGLDENEKAWSALADICSSVPDRNCMVWVTGRSCDGMNRLLGSCLFDQYHLLPFSVEDVMSLATQVKENGAFFHLALVNQQLASYATKPGGAILLLKLYGEGKLKSCTRIQLTEEIAKSFARDGRDGIAVPANETNLSDTALIDCAAWIAAQLFFSGKRSLWLGTAIECPDDALAFDSLPRGKYPDELFRAVTKRRLFEPLFTDRFRFAYDTVLMPFLVAAWLKQHAPADILDGLLLSDRAPTASVLAVMKYLCLYLPELGPKWIVLSPKSFIDCPKAVELFGDEKFYCLLESQYLETVTDGRHDFLEGHVDLLLGQKGIADIALSRLADPDCDPRKAVLAAWLLRLTHHHPEQRLTVLIALLERQWQSLGSSVRCDLTHEITSMLKFDSPDAQTRDVQKRLRKLLDLLEVKDLYDEDTKGCLLLYLWPEALKTEEIIDYFTTPIDKDVATAYTLFLASTFPNIRRVLIPQQNMRPMLERAFTSNICRPSLKLYGELAADLVSTVPKEAANPMTAALLSEYDRDRVRRLHDDSSDTSPNPAALAILNRLSREECPVGELSQDEFREAFRPAPSPVPSADNKQLTEHCTRCRWIFSALEAWRQQLKAQFEDPRCRKRPFPKPPTVEWLTDWINVNVFDSESDADPISPRQIRWSLELALGMTINDIKGIYADWKERQLKTVAPDEKWTKKGSAAYRKLKQQIEAKPQYFDYRIFTYWVGLHLEPFIRLPKQLDFKAVVGSVSSIETIFTRLDRFRT